MTHEHKDIIEDFILNYAEIDFEGFLLSIKKKPGLF